MQTTEVSDLPRCSVDEGTPLLSRKPKFRWAIVIVLCALMTIVTASSELTWPFVNQMIVDVGAAPDPKSVGFYSGLIETIASFFGFVMIYPGNFAADRWGRKPVLYGALLGTAGGQALFGLSGTLFGLIACRSIVYGLGPQLAWSIVITVLGDLADSDNHAAAFAATNASYRVGQFLSPLFAAALAHPATRHEWFKSTLWESRPYALPCFGGAILCIGGVYMAACFLPETAPGLSGTIKLDEQDVEVYGSVSTPKDPEIVSQPVAVAVQDATAPSQLLPVTLDPVAHQIATSSHMTILTTHITQLLVSSWIMYFISISFATLFPLWAFTPVASGGLGASESEIGIYLSVRAVIHFFSLAPFAYCEKWLGAYRLYSYSLAVFSLGSAVLLPLLNWQVSNYSLDAYWTNLTMLLYFFVCGFTNYCTTCMVMMMNQAAPSAQTLSRLVGISQTVLGIGQCMAPIVTLSIFEFSIKSEVLDGNIIWIFLFATSFIATVHSFTLTRPALDK